MKKILYLLCLMLASTTINVYTQQLENLGKNINSESSELLPKITVDGKTLYFIRSDYKDNLSYQYIWASELDENGNWGKSYKLGNPFNKGDANNIYDISVDGNTLSYSNYFHKTSKQELYQITKKDNTWDEPITPKNNMEDKNQFINSKWGSSFTAGNGKVYFFAATKAKDDDFSEIYVGFNVDGIWKKAIKLSKPINVNEGDYGQSSPFLASDDVTLYFSSERKGGFGKTDIYMSRRLDDTWLNWSEPVNLGPVINSSGYEMYYTISAKGDYAYVTSNKNSEYGDGDLYRIKLHEQVKPKPVVLVSGKVVNPGNNQPLDAAITYYTLPEGTEAGITHSNPANGTYKIVLPYGKQYSFLAKVNGYYSISNYLDLTSTSEYKEMNVNIDMKPIEVGETFRLSNIFFDFAQATLRSESFQELDRVYNLLSDNGTIEIELSGHTDNVGSDEINNTLSQSRADAVKDYLVKKGINESRIISKGYGKSNPVATNDTEEGRQFNRRVEFKILKK